MTLSPCPTSIKRFFSGLFVPVFAPLCAVQRVYLLKNEYEHENSTRTSSSAYSTTKISLSRKRKLVLEEEPLEPYRKKPKMCRFDYARTDIINATVPHVNQLGESLDFIWMASHSLNLDDIPMWIVFNSKFCKDSVPKQVVRYMQNMRNPITGLDVIQETLKITKRCTQECGQKYGIVSYDLNAAKPAL